jgi:hypothetical protein
VTTPRDYLATAGVWEVLGLIVAEFKSDPTSVQCFDLRLVARACALVAEHEGGQAGRLWLIWSIQKNAWWKPESLGYTRAVAEAGRYTLDEAERILRQCNLITVNECAVPLAAVEPTP